MADDVRAARDSFRFGRLSLDGREEIANDWQDSIYFCPECDEAERDAGAYRGCSRYPKEHDGSGYMGTGKDYPASVRRLAKKISRIT